MGPIARKLIEQYPFFVDCLLFVCITGWRWVPHLLRWWPARLVFNSPLRPTSNESFAETNLSRCSAPYSWGTPTASIDLRIAPPGCHKQWLLTSRQLSSRVNHHGFNREWLWSDPATFLCTKKSISNQITAKFTPQLVGERSRHPPESVRLNRFKEVYASSGRDVANINTSEEI